jgi:NitT/TauT family transport system substrate-binding protein
MRPPDPTPARPAARIPTLAALAVVLLLGSGACSRRAQAPASGLQAATFQSDWLAQPEHGGFYQALCRGFYRDAGLEVTLTPGGPNSFTPQMVATGKVDFSIGRIDDIFAAVSNGIPLLVVAPQMQHDPQAIMVHAASAVRGFADLDNHTITASPGVFYLQVIERKFGIKVQVVPIDYGLARFSADPEAIQQTFITSDPYFLAKMKVPIRLFPIRESGYDPYRVIYTSRGFAARHPDIVRAFVAASLRGWASYMDPKADRTAADALLAEQNPKMTDPGLIEFTVKAMRENHLVEGNAAAGEKLGMLDWKRVQEITDFMHLVGGAAAMRTPDEAVSLDYLPEPLRGECKAIRARVLAAHP